MKRGMGIALAALVLTGATSCGSDEAEPKAATKADVTIEGTLRVDSVASTRYVESDDTCRAIDTLGEKLYVGAPGVVVVSDPNGKEVGLLDITATQYETYKNKGVDYVSRGICTFVFSGTIKADPDDDTSVYKAAAPDFGIEKRFTLGQARTIRMDLKPQ